ncbi:hypothetical protein BDV26DRAFT_305782 [Aspergillus bertholletiae]|uniref:Uncharacterized protein n=1 Tax=Aspergillus bertholletiae TaxID=1226010 RepID=A0A5N7B211_9EURO|nr:hypothetical protein BDV26DRAFT_305782 [Aspergillus bertholletiae]
MPCQIYDDPDIYVSPGHHHHFISLLPGEEDHLQTTVKLPYWVCDAAIEPSDNGGRLAIVVPASNIVEFTIFFLLILSIFPFVPQLDLLRQNGGSMGTSLVYLLCNVLNATEQFTISFSYLFIAEDSEFFIYSPPNAGDWLNFFQLAVTWSLSSTLFFFGVICSPAHNGRKTFILGIYLTFLSISLLAAVAYVLINPCGASCGSNGWVTAIFLGSHLIFVNPVVTLLAIAALPAQLRVLKQHEHTALSLIGLASQAVIFTVLGFSWLFRVRLDYNLSDFFRTWGSFTSWYQLVGWVAVDNLIFAAVQGILLLVVLRRKKMAITEGENEPLLGH